MQFMTAPVHPEYLDAVSFKNDAHKLRKSVDGRLISFVATYAAATPLGRGTGT
jgi:hypothetical protein